MSTVATSAPEIVKTINHEHNLFRERFDAYKKLSDKDELEKAQPIATEIFDELDRHTKQEETHVFPSLKEIDEDFYYEAVQEHHVGDLLIAEMRTMKLGPIYKAKMAVLIETTESHFEEEQETMFPALAKLPDDQLARMAKDWTPWPKD